MMEEDKIKFKMEQEKNITKQFKKINALKRKLKRLKTEKPEPKPRKVPEFKIEPLI